MDVQEIISALQGIKALVGGHGEVFVSFASYDRRVSAAIYPNGIAHNPSLRVEGDTFAELIANLRDRWTEHESKHCKEMVKAMALAIIRITSERGVCRDCDLRTEGHDVAKWGTAAVERANDMASNGPFSITKVKSANAA